jgi:hypothetical protein
MRVEVIRQTSLETVRDSSAVTILGKAFRIADTSPRFRVIVHDDFPMITEDDVRGFISDSMGKRKIVVSGCPCDVHPYRLMVIDSEGHDGHFVDIPQTVRGNRQSYPEVYSLVPALMGIPPRVSVKYVGDPRKMDIYPMPRSKLLDRSSRMDGLMIRSLSRDARKFVDSGH